MILKNLTALIAVAESVSKDQNYAALGEEFIAAIKDVADPWPRLHEIAASYKMKLAPELSIATRLKHAKQLIESYVTSDWREDSGRIRAGQQTGEFNQMRHLKDDRRFPQMIMLIDYTLADISAWTNPQPQEVKQLPK